MTLFLRTEKWSVLESAWLCSVTRTINESLKSQTKDLNGETDIFFVSIVPLVKSTDVNNGWASISCPNNCAAIVALG